MTFKKTHIVILLCLSYQCLTGQNLAIEIEKGLINGDPRSFPSFRLHSNVVYYYYDQTDNLTLEFHLRSKSSSNRISLNYCDFDSTNHRDRILFYYTYSNDSSGKQTHKNLYFPKQRNRGYQSDQTIQYFYDKANRISEKRIIFDPLDTNRFQYYRYYYDSVDNLTLIDSHTSNDSIFEKRYFYYNSKNLKIEEKLVKVPSQVTETDFYFYDKTDKLIKSTTKDPFNYETYYKYDRNGQLVKEKCYCDGKWLKTVEYIYRKCTSANSGRAGNWR